MSKQRKLLPNSHPGVYPLDCLCNGRYFGESKKVFTCCIEYPQDSIKRNWELSGITKHRNESHAQFNWTHPRTIAIKQSMYKRKMCEAIGINRLKPQMKHIKRSKC